MATVAQLTVQLAREAGIDPSVIADSLRRAPATRAVADQVVAAARSTPGAVATRSTAIAPRSSATPARTSAEGGAGGAGGKGGGVIEWAQEPVLWLPLPGKERRSVGISPLMLLLAYLAYRHFSTDDK